MQQVEIASGEHLPYSNRNCVKATCALAGRHAATDPYKIVPGMLLFAEEDFETTQGQDKRLLVCPRVVHGTGYNFHPYPDELKKRFVGVSTGCINHKEAELHEASRCVNVAVKGVVCLVFPNCLLPNLPIGSIVGIDAGWSHSSFRNTVMPDASTNTAYPTLLRLDNQFLETAGIGVVVEHPRAKSQENWIKVQLF